jgi:hypothetical protein
LSIEVLATPPPNQNYQPPISRLNLDSLDELGVFVPGPPAFTIDDGLQTVAELHRFGVTPVLGSGGTDIVGVGAHALWRRENAEDPFGVLGGELATGLRRIYLPEHRPPLRRRRDEMAARRTEELALEVNLTHFRWAREHASFTVVDNNAVIPGVPPPVLHPGIGRIWQSPPRLRPVGG